MNFYEGEGGPALEISTKRLQHLQGKMAKYIDGGNLLSTGFRVSAGILTTEPWSLDCLINPAKNMMRDQAKTAQ